MTVKALNGKDVVVPVWTWAASPARNRCPRWNLLANQVPFAPNDTNADPLIKTHGGEKWDGYPAGRQKVLDAIDVASKSGVRVVGAISDQRAGTESSVEEDRAAAAAPARRPLRCADGDPRRAHALLHSALEIIL